MMDIMRYGIGTIHEGDYSYNLPRWATDPDMGTYAIRDLLYAGGDDFYPFPLSNLEINELIPDIQYYMEIDEVKMSEDEEAALRKALATGIDALEEVAEKYGDTKKEG